MNWTKRDGVWVSGPYAIELVEPEMWVLTRRSEDSATSQVEVEDQVGPQPEAGVAGRWTGRSLHRMKRKAESIEDDVRRAGDRRRHLAIAIAAFVVFVMVAGVPGPITATVAIAAAGVLIYGLVRAVDETMRRRPWENLPERYQ